MSSIHEYFIKQAIKVAADALEHDDVPVGAVVVYKNQVIAKAHNQVELLKDPTAHAEMLAITSACDSLKSKWLIGATLYVTIEPCSMCAGAAVLARVKQVVFGAADPKTGACGSVLNIANNLKLNHKISVKGEVLKDDCALLLREFFRKQRIRQAARNN